MAEPDLAVKMPRGGRRATTGQPRFTAQIVGLVEPDIKSRIEALGGDFGLSQAQVIRAIIARGLGTVERGLRSGTITPGSLA